jgi:enoyl-[acyl-carrier protein] reductase/trans-2-enoyl-CoA reductase (NAD+)
VIIEPVTRGYLCATAHPSGCARRVAEQIGTVRSRPFDGPRRALVIGASAGLGLATRTALAFGAGTATIGVCRERPGSPGRPGTAGWYNTAAFEAAAAVAGRYARTVNGDAFSTETTEATAATIAADLGAVDLLVYSIAAPRRVDPATGAVHRSVLKAIGEPFTDKGFDVVTGQVRRMTVAPASSTEIDDTVSVMGGEDLRRWVTRLRAAGVLAPGAQVLAFSYLGGERLAPTYRLGTIGRAKDDLEATVRELDGVLAPGGRARTAVMQAFVTQSSLAIPMSTLYTILLLRVMRELGTEETVGEQVRRLLAGHVFAGAAPVTDERGRLRMDDGELRADVQAEVARRWELVRTENLAELGAPDEFLARTRRLYGFEVEGVDYRADVDPVREISGLVSVDSRQPSGGAHDDE